MDDVATTAQVLELTATIPDECKSDDLSPLAAELLQHPVMHIIVKQQQKRGCQTSSKRCK